MTHIKLTNVPRLKAPMVWSRGSAGAEMLGGADMLYASEARVAVDGERRAHGGGGDQVVGTDDLPKTSHGAKV